MRKLFSALLALGMLMTGFFGVAAQDASNSIASGMNSAATWTDDRGSQVATLEVVDINTDWTDHTEYSSPDRGYLYQAVTFTVTNLSGSNLIVEPYSFSLVDELGRNNGRTYVSVPDELEDTLFSDDVPLAAGESAELTLVFQTPIDVAASTLVWQPESGIIVLVQFAASERDDAAIVTGFDTPSTWTDDRGNPVATFEVTDVEDEWTDYDEYREPSRGMVYRAVHFTVTNVSGSSMIVEPYDFSLLDTTGQNNGRSWVEAKEGSENPVFIEDTALAADESIDGIMVFEMYPDVDPAAMIWQSDRGILNVVILADDGADTGETAATPAADDEDATPEDLDAVPSDEDEESDDEGTPEAGVIEDVVADQVGVSNVVSTTNR